MNPEVVVTPASHKDSLDVHVHLPSTNPMDKVNNLLAILFQNLLLEMLNQKC